MRPAITTLALTRSWLFVPYGERAPTASGRPTITCDGRVAGATLELTHWTDNATPDALYADTSTECALNLARARLERSEYADYDDALVINNHFDTDGVLSIWACLQPSEALDCAPLLASGAAAGDFGEWQTDAGVKLDLAIGAMSAETDDDADAYDLCLDRLPWLLDDLASGDYFDSYERVAARKPPARSQRTMHERVPRAMRRWARVAQSVGTRLARGRSLIRGHRSRSGEDLARSRWRSRALRERGRGARQPLRPLARDLGPSRRCRARALAARARFGNGRRVQIPLCL